MRDPDREGHPIVTGLLALVAVTVVVGGIVGGGAFAASRVLGLDGDTAAARDSATANQTLYAPEPTSTSPTGAGLTLSSDPSSTATEATSSPPTVDPTTTATRAPRKAINLAAGQTAVSPLGEIDLTGTYPGGEGALLQVQQFSGGTWHDFPVNPVSVSNGQFSTYVQTSQVGLNKFRMVNTASGARSNAVRVSVG